MALLSCVLFPRKMGALVVSTLCSSEGLYTCRPRCATSVCLGLMSRHGLGEQCLWSWYTLFLVTLNSITLYSHILFGLWSYSHAQYVWSLRPSESLLRACYENFPPHVRIWKLPNLLKLCTNHHLHPPTSSVGSSTTSKKTSFRMA